MARFSGSKGAERVFHKTEVFIKIDSHNLFVHEEMTRLKQRRPMISKLLHLYLIFHHVLQHLSEPR